MSLLQLRTYQCALQKVCNCNSDWPSVGLSAFLGFSALDLVGVNAAGTGPVFACWLINCKLQGCLPGKPH